MTLNELKESKVAVLGFGKEGQSTFNFLRSKGIEISAVLDSKHDLTDELKKILGSVAYVGGENYLDNLNQYDVLFRSPGLPRFHPKLAAFKNQSGILSQTKLFFDLCPCSVVAVTGTKGKTTTTSLVYEILKKDGKDVYLGGNIGVPPLELLDDLKPESIAVLEVSSFQSIDLEKSPHVGVILNVTHDHLDDGTFRPASHSSQEEYYKAKAQLIANQTQDDFAILNPNLSEIFTASGKGKKIFYHPEDAAGYERKLLGRHNLENIAAAVKACEVLGANQESIRQAVADFSGVKYRLQLVGEKDGIKFVNDSASSNPDSTIAAIDSFEQGIVLILGGSDKQLDYSELGKKIKEARHVKGLVVIGQITPIILKATEGVTVPVKTGAKDMKEIVSQALEIAKSGNVVVLSPAAASFDMFENYKDRGDQFERVVNAL